MAIGAGNIWRFPRILAKFEGGGGTFLIPWAIFLFTWSIPLLLAETAIGRKTRAGVIASMGRMMGPRRTWIGAFVALCTTMIMCYYAVVAGWCLLYVIESLRGEVALLGHEEAQSYFEGIAQSGYSALGMVAAFGIAGFFVARGIRRGIELANKLFLPVLFALLVVLIFAGLSKEGAADGVAYMFRVDWSALATPDPWLEGLSQSAWSTGAGWGLLLVLSVGAKSREHSVGDAFLTGIGNNIASLVAALATIPAVFAMLSVVAPEASVTAVLQTNGSGGTGMAMVWLPKIFAGLGDGGPLLGTIFFVALSFAATTSLIAMVELATRTLVDLGIERRRAIYAVLVGGVLLGLPSALSLDVFANQDWVWGVGLMVSGFLFSVAIAFVGYRRFREDWIGMRSSGWAGRGLELLLMLGIPLQFVLLLGWWFWQSFGWSTAEGAAAAFDPFGAYTIGTCLFQWVVAFALLFALNRVLSKGIPERSSETED
jgi:NSS family neurotransmitter:Na+ symporter